jgi:type II secretory pathway pseudopilin PulG
MTEEPTEAPTPPPIPQPAAPSKKRPIMRRKGRDRGRELLVVLGILVVALAMLTIWSYTTLSSENTELQSQLTALNTTHHEYVATHSYTDTEVDELMQIINLEKSEVLQENLTFIQNAGDTITFQYAKPYAGYLEVLVNSTSITTFVTVQYDAFEFSFDETQVVGRGGLAVFPILPSDEISVIVGNENFLQEATITIQITYHY